MVIAELPGHLDQVGAKLAHKLNTAHGGVDHEPLPHAAEIRNQAELVQLIVDGRARGDAGAADTALAAAGDEYVATAVPLVFAAVKIWQTKLAPKTALAQTVVLPQQSRIPTQLKLDSQGNSPLVDGVVAMYRRGALAPFDAVSGNRWRAFKQILCHRSHIFYKTMAYGGDMGYA